MTALEKINKNLTPSLIISIIVIAETPGGDRPHPAQAVRVELIVGLVEYEDLNVVYRFLHPVRQLGDGFPDHLFEVGKNSTLAPFIRTCDRKVFVSESTVKCERCLVDPRRSLLR